jgi:predicted DNA-binding mobile mystery protein A
MTTKQMASRLGVSQPRIVELEQSEMHGNVTLNTLRRAAEALDCRVVYAIVPNRRLKDVVSERAEALASRMTAAVEQSMRLEAQEVGGKAIAKDHRRRAMERLMLRPARLWDEA